MGNVRPKKALGQHFLKNEEIAERISQSLWGGTDFVLEVGPGMGMLTKYLYAKYTDKLFALEVDSESVDYLLANAVLQPQNLMNYDFLKLNIPETFKGSVGVIGNYPYNISSQILFHVLKYKESVPELAGMFQREVAVRVSSGPGNKDYGVLSVLLQAYYDIEYLFTVDENEFNPPPKVKSGVIRMKRNGIDKLACDESLFKAVVKATFNQRRKTIRNSIRSVTGKLEFEHPFLKERPERLGVSEFVELTNVVAKLKADNA